MAGKLPRLRDIPRRGRRTRDSDRARRRQHRSKAGSPTSSGLTPGTEIRPPISTELTDRIAVASFETIVDGIENLEPPNPPAAVWLYRHWIASQPPNAPLLFAAWFNLGVALSQTGDPANAIVAYQNVLSLRPDFHSAATNLGLLLESLGQPDTALRTWERALQPDDARTTLLNHRARLLEQLNRLEEAEREMRRSLLIDPKQPDVIQHWVHARQKMCDWPILTNEIPGLAVHDLLRHAGPSGDARFIG